MRLFKPLFDLPAKRRVLVGRIILIAGMAQFFITILVLNLQRAQAWPNPPSSFYGLPWWVSLVAVLISSLLAIVLGGMGALLILGREGVTTVASLSKEAGTHSNRSLSRRTAFQLTRVDFEDVANSSFGLGLGILVVAWQSLSQVPGCGGIIVLGLLLVIAYDLGSFLRNTLVQNENPWAQADHPVPRKTDIQKIGLRMASSVAILTVFLLIMGWIFILAGGPSLWGWLWGIITCGLWQFLFSLFQRLTTKYWILNEGLLIVHGVGRVFIPYSDLASAHLELISRDPTSYWTRRRTFTFLGTRQNNLLEIRWTTERRLRGVIFTRRGMYLSPTHPSQFKDLLEQHIPRRGESLPGIAP